MASYEIGKYAFRVTNQGFGKSKEKGTPFFFLEGLPVARIVNGNQINVEANFSRTITLHLTENTIENVIEKLRGLGWEGTKWANLDLKNPGSFSLIDQEIEANCTHEPAGDGSGRLFDKFDLPWANRDPLESDSSVTAKVDAMFGKALKSKPAAKQADKKTETVPPSDSDAPADDDIPF